MKAAVSPIGGLIRSPPNRRSCPARSGRSASAGLNPGSIAIGRTNWLFAGSKAGGERAAAIYTVIETCKLNGIERQAYIADIIAKIAGNWPAARWDELMPWNWRPDFQRIAEAT